MSRQCRSREDAWGGNRYSPVGQGADVMRSTYFGGTSMFSFGWEYADLKL